MGKIVVSEFLSLDGVMEEPDWSLRYWNDAIAQFKDEEMTSASALLLGRVTYDGFAEAWPTANDPMADQMNGIRKYVVSTTLQKAEWSNSHIISTDILAAITKLRQETEGNLLVAGSAMLIQMLVAHQLVDDYRLLVYPMVLGKGKRLFQDGVAATLTLSELKPMGGGVVALRYQSAAKGEH